MTVLTDVSPQNRPQPPSSSVEVLRHDEIDVEPALIGVLLTFWLWTSLSGTAFTVGGVWLGVGLLWLALLTRGFTPRPPQLHLSEVDEVDEVDDDLRDATRI